MLRLLGQILGLSGRTWFLLSLSKFISIALKPWVKLILQPMIISIVASVWVFFEVSAIPRFFLKPVPSGNPLWCNGNTASLFDVGKLLEISLLQPIHSKAPRLQIWAYMLRSPNAETSRSRNGFFQGKRPHLHGSRGYGWSFREYSQGKR